MAAGRSDQVTSATRSTRPCDQMAIRVRVERTFGLGLGHDQHPVARAAGRPGRRASASGGTRWAAASLRRRSTPAQPPSGQRECWRPSRGCRAAVARHCSFTPSAAGSPRRNRCRVLPQVAHRPVDLADGPIHVLDQPLQVGQPGLREADHRRAGLGSPRVPAGRRARAVERGRLQIAQGSLATGASGPAVKPFDRTQRLASLLDDRRQSPHRPDRGRPAAAGRGRAICNSGPSGSANRVGEPRHRAHVAGELLGRCRSRPWR